MGAGVGVLALAGTFSFVSARRGKTGLSEQEPSPHSFSKCVCVCNLLGNEGWRVLYHSGECTPFTPGVCVCYFDIFFPLPSPHGLNASAGSCSGLYTRPVSTPISSSDLLLPRSADTISSPSFPAHLFPATYFPTDFFFFCTPPFFPPCLSRACRE